MPDDTPPTRTLTESVRIDAPIERVWRALTEADELTNWFPPEARVTPGEGGAVAMRWSDDMSFESPIDVWVPNRRLRLVHCEPTDDVPARVTVEYTLEGDGGSTVLRLTHAGLLDHPAWNDLYDATQRGWQSMLPALKRYLERHDGRTRDPITLKRSIADRSVGEAWAALDSPDGLAADGSLTGHDEGDPIRLTTSAGDILAGTVRRSIPPKDLELSLDDWNDGLLRIQIDDLFGRRDVYLTAWLWGVDPARVQRLRENLASILGRLFPEA